MAGKPIELKRTCQECGEKSAAHASRCQACGESFRASRLRREEEADGGGALGPEKAIVNNGVWGGVLAIMAAVIWFVVGWQAGYIYYYPPVLAIVGVIAIVNGLGASSAGARSRRRR
jgi:hypothetical protein